MSDLQALHDAVVAHSGLSADELRDAAAHGADAGWGTFLADATAAASGIGASS